MNRRLISGLCVIFFLAVVVFHFRGYRMWGAGPHRMAEASAGDTALVSVKVPALSETARLGQAVFSENCAACHGQNGVGVDGAGPPLVHIIYEPGHHADIAFYRAVNQGVPAHHWRFGNMPAVPGVDERDVMKIITYIRELQRANGIN